MSDSPKRKLAYTVFARNEVTKQSQYRDRQDKSEIAAVILKQQDSLAMTGVRK